MTNEKRLIDINYALKQLDIGELENGGSFSTDSLHIKDFLKVLPNVDAVEVVHGRWVPVKGFSGFFTWEVQCSECGTPQDQKSNYCPYCGARMDGGANE